MVNSWSIRSLSSRRFDSLRSADQSSGIGVIAKNVGRPRSSGPGAMSIAPPDERRNFGVHWISSGSSARPMRSRSRQNASISAFSWQAEVEEHVGGRVFRGDGVEDATHEGAVVVGTRPVRAPRRPDLAGDADHLGPDHVELALGAGEDPLRGQLVGAHGVAHLPGEPFGAQAAIALARGQDHVAQVRREGLERGAGRGRGRLESRLERDHRHVAGIGGPRGFGQRFRDELVDPGELGDGGLGLEPTDRLIARSR